MLLSMGIVIAASAQHRGGGYRGHSYHPRTRIVVGLGSGYYSPYYPLYPYDYGYGYYNRPFYRPSGLQMKIADIEADYKDRIWSARHNRSLPKNERKQTIHRLRTQRDQAIRDAERNYYKSY
jgi:hypothetical protein